MESTGLGQLYDREVVDSNGNKVGTVEGVWADAESGGLEFIGVHGSVFTRGVHVVPAANIHTDGNRITLPFDKDRVNDSPRFSNEDVLSDEDEEKIYNHFGIDSASRVPGNMGGVAVGAGSRMAGTDAANSSGSRDTTTSDTASNSGITQSRVRSVARSETTGGSTTFRREVEIERVPKDNSNRSESGASEFNRSTDSTS